MTRAEQMEAWLRDKTSRTVEERFGAEVIIEQVHRAFFVKQRWQWEETWDEQTERKKARRLNPAYKPQIHYSIVSQRVAPIADEITSLHISCSDDRFVRDVSFLQFFPNITDLQVTGGALANLDPLKYLPRLESLMISDQELADLRPISVCKNLKTLYLNTYVPWPEFPDLSQLPQLTYLNWRGNLLLLETLPCLPALEKADLNHGFGTGTPLRDFKQLPEMPRLRCLKLDSIASLEGVERFSTLVNLDVRGPFRDLTPLAALPRTTHLIINRGDVLHSDFTFDVAPLARMPELREVKFITDQPIDFAPLIDSPKLREISREGWHVKDSNLNAMEVNTINAVLASWDEDYALIEPRALPPLVFRAVEDIHKVFADEERSKSLHSEQSQNPMLQGSEGQWIARKLNAALTQLLGEKWGEVDGGIDPYMTIQTLEAAEQMPEIVSVIRVTLARSRRKRHVFLVVDLDAEWETEGDEWDPEAEFKREFEEHLCRKKEIAERKAYLERLYQVRLKEQEGVAIDPRDFAPDTTEPAETKTDPEPEQDSDVAVYQEKQKRHPMAEVLWSRLWICEDGAYVSHRDQAAMEHLMKRHADPG